MDRCFLPRGPGPSREPTAPFLSRLRGLPVLARLLLAAPAALVLAPAWAQAPVASPSAPAAPCAEAGGYALTDCLATEFAKADAALNAAWKKVNGLIAADPDTPADQKAAWKAHLLAAQKAWLAFRDADCRFELVAAEWHNGSGTTAAQQQCALELTQARTRELLERYAPN
ncbi:lysozyme inhibitor LprI family protein [Ancylobacter lacus]|uniref:lysozyme inhibitor LprI family protein n=1 Tax=Ancylobacter lacus TaxID=2579970 RepID=UPI001BCBD4CE|nr:lysozyme inhibitor LprI family protein [Ancylobacter lacus]MBS7538097.1 DUF1311 domain-containing protein [Ancylobacter lacus]